MGSGCVSGIGGLDTIGDIVSDEVTWTAIEQDSPSSSVISLASNVSTIHPDLVYPIDRLFGPDWRRFGFNPYSINEPS